MKFCKNCGIQLEDENSKFCPNCGIDLRQKLQQNNDERSMLNSIPSIEERTPKYKKSFKNIICKKSKNRLKHRRTNMRNTYDYCRYCH